MTNSTGNLSSLLLVSAAALALPLSALGTPRPLFAQRIARGLNHGRKSYKVIQDCTICVSCRWIRSSSVVSR